MSAVVKFPENKDVMQQLVADEELNRVPFGAPLFDLLDGDDEDWLVQCHREMKEMSLQMLSWKHINDEDKRKFENDWWYYLQMEKQEEADLRETSVGGFDREMDIELIKLYREYGKRYDIIGALMNKSPLDIKKRCAKIRFDYMNLNKL